ncbi:hypothetical protein [Fusobacterium sp.]|uniref:hypothetical protein n=1 Tax=Fusobacterium sp. TaxID=68766 RepID=UPI002606CE46|nr:hypothetical protein [Fusobacterium sp.]
MEVILFVVEGAKEEPKIIDSLKNIFLNDKVIIKILYGTSIYHLYSKIREDEDIEILEILREMSTENRKILKNLKRSQISSIFLFFDQDSHNSNASETKLETLINFFDNEYENGKLYISYPMVEALRDIEHLDENNDISLCEWNIDENRVYKKYVADRLIRCKLTRLSIYKDYNDKTWNCINKYNWRKGNFLIRGESILPSYEILSTFSQDVIFKKQLDKIKQNKNIITLSGFSFFVAFYFKKEKIEEMIQNFY